MCVLFLNSVATHSSHHSQQAQASSDATLTHQRPMVPPNRNQSIDLQGKLIDWFLYDKGICR